MSKRIYIALPRDYARETSYAAEDALTLLGYEPANPADNGTNDRANLCMLTQCDGVLLTPGWETSPMSTIAVTVAKHLNIPVGTYDQWSALAATGGQR
ncbi:MAG: DUF4406 domain-containing protein [Schaalia sp.]|jgi:hypothetical protein|nr:DUF4406 domain-containing protein [Schaalia sp.]